MFFYIIIKLGKKTIMLRNVNKIQHWVVLNGRNILFC